MGRSLPVAEPVMEQVMELVLKTHPENETAPEMVKKYVGCGASPRGAQAIIAIARVLALLDGRYHVSFGDVQAAAKEALHHRIFLNFEAFADGVTADAILDGFWKEERL